MRRLEGVFEWGIGIVVVFRLDGNMDVGGSWSFGLAGVVPRSVLDRRGGAETSRGRLKEDGKETW